jgi:hypothetical protein
MLTQVLQLPAHIVGAMFQEAGVKLDTCLTHLPPRLHPAALIAVFPEVQTQRVLRIDAACSRWSQTSQMSKHVKRLPLHLQAPKPGIGNCVCLASREVLCALLKVVAGFPRLCELHLGVQSLQADSLVERGHSSYDPVTDRELAAAITCSFSALTELKALSVGSALQDPCGLAAMAAVLPKLPLQQFSTRSAVVSCLASCTGLTSLHLNELHLSGTGNCVSTVLRELPQLQQLALTESVLTAKSVAALARSLACLPGLRSLNLCRVSWDDTSADACSLIEACANISTLVRLYLLYGDNVHTVTASSIPNTNVLYFSGQTKLRDITASQYR